MLPLYDSSSHRIPEGEGAARNKEHAGAHTGLWFERFFNQYSDDYSVKDNAKSHFIGNLAGYCGDTAKLTQAYLRQAALVEVCGGTSVTLQSDWHFVTGLGSPHPVENSLLFHPTLAVPYLPGSSVKGLVRAWLEQQFAGQPAAGLFHRLFGSENKDPSQCKADSQAGEVIFFDALPIKPVELVLDTMTPHMGGWYEKGGTADASQAANQPADWHDPIPVPFLVAKEVVLQFSFAPRKPSADSQLLLKIVSKALHDALSYAGAGAKTAAGYGSFSAINEDNQRIIERLNSIQVETAEALQKAAQLAELSNEERLICALVDDAEKPENQQAGTAGDFLIRLTDALALATGWKEPEKQALLNFYSTYKKHLSKKKEKDLRPLIAALRSN